MSKIKSLNIILSFFLLASCTKSVEREKQLVPSQKELEIITQKLNSQSAPVTEISVTIFNAIEDGNIGFVGKYLEDGNNIEIVDEYNRSLLLIAAQAQQFEIVQLLFEAGLRDRFSGTTVLATAADANRFEIVKLLIEVDDSLINAQGIHAPESPIVSAIYHNNIDMLQYLIAQGANVSVSGCPPRCLLPIMFACIESNLEMVKILHENGAELNMIDSDSSVEMTALDFAIESGNDELISYLINNGAKEYRDLYPSDV